jgi:hypothetical protein
VLSLIAMALAAAAPSTAPPSPMLEASVPWWERITVTVDDKGAQQSCKYHSSLSPTGAEACDEATASSVQARGPKGPSGVYSKLTFERRFSPGAKLDSGRLQTGDKLLGQQVMFLTIDPKGTIESCRVLARSGDMIPAYGCAEAESEQFRAQANAPSGAARQAFMTILVYGHQEQIA